MKHKGFTLIESLVAISILMVGILSSFMLVIRSLNMAPLIQENLNASFLAQQAIESVIQKRDNNWLSGVSWNEGLADGSYCVIVNSGNATIGALAGDCLIDTKFNRVIYINNEDIDKLKVTCTINWVSRGKSYAITVVDYLYNWAKEYFPS